MKKYHLIMEKFWLAVAVLTFIFAVYKIGQNGIMQEGINLIMPLIAAALYYLRYYTRKRIEQHQNNKEE